ncbi:hypothetical protein N8J89_20610 [Crossiella sp. CA-258035]|uniref:hypothetical protein n=1 Tax=Crossiella sp. CA-258035 TaxID=2981138 RepID=UPI0024BCE6CE|nr:hypothetical protein [Crossiella sp. CA-258035]WHT23386.1 hypothetical protein N8J89_20610 [Crossiella sp. CA-258035]
MTANTRISLNIIAVAAAVIAALFLLNRPDTPAPAAQPGPQGRPPTMPAEVLVRPDSHKLSTAPDGKVTVVEFLDLECEACRAALPGVERLRAEPDSRRDEVDAIILATDYRPDVAYLEPLGAVDGDGRPRHRAGVSTVHPGLGFVGLELQWSRASVSLHGVGAHAGFVVSRLVRRGAVVRQA